MDEPRAPERPRPLDSPALRRVLATLETAGRSLAAVELASALGLHVTTVRSHLERLEDAGLVAHEVLPEGRRGRPGFRYRATRSDPDLARDELIGVLAAALATVGAGGDAALLAGRGWAERLAVGEPDAVAALTTAFQRLGFEPEAAGDLIRLHGCPFRQAARAHPDVVCRVHLGLAERLAEQAGGGVRLELRPFVEPELCLVALAADRPDEPAPVPG